LEALERIPILIQSDSGFFDNFSRVPSVSMASIPFDIARQGQSTPAIWATGPRFQQAEALRTCLISRYAERVNPVARGGSGSVQAVGQSRWAGLDERMLGGNTAQTGAPNRPGQAGAPDWFEPRPAWRTNSVLPISAEKQYQSYCRSFSGLSSRLRRLAIELLEELVGLVEATHCIGAATGIRVMVERLIAISITDLIKREALAVIGG